MKTSHSDFVYAPVSIRFHRENGMSLVELLIALAIGLFLVAVISILFVNSKMIYLAQDANSRLQENSRYAMEVLSQQIRSAGYTDIQFTQLTAANLFAKPPAFSFTGAPIAGSNGTSDAPDEITFSYDGTTDCLGNKVTSPITNLFRISGKKLECLGNGSATAGTILDGIEDLQVLYGQPASGGKFSYLPASVNLTPATTVQLCLVLRTQADTDKRGTGTQNQTYINCQGSTTTASDGYLRRSLTMTVNLRNRLP